MAEQRDPRAMSDRPIRDYPPRVGPVGPAGDSGAATDRPVGPTPCRIGPEFMCDVHPDGCPPITDYEGTDRPILHEEDVDDYTMCVCGSPMDACPGINGDGTNRPVGASDE